MSRTQFFAVLISLLTALLTGGASYSQNKKRPKRPKGDKKDKKDDNKKDKDNVVGKRWEYTARQGGEEIESGSFRAADQKIFRGAEQIGTYSRAGGGDLKLEIEKGKLKGTIELRLIRTDPRPVYAGEWEMAGGSKANIQVEFLED